MNGLKIPYINIQKQYKTIRDEILNAQDLVYSSGNMLSGKYTKQFESEMAIRCNRKYALTVNSCTQALIFANIIVGNDSSVLMPAVSFIATLNSALMTNRTVHFNDVDNQGLFDFNNPSANPFKTLIFVDLYGNVVDQAKLNSFVSNFNDITVIEDAAQSFGASWCGKPAGSFGDISCLSFDPMKNLPNYGSGGMLLTDNESSYRMALNLRDNGKLDKYIIPGTNSKMSESDCASMLIKLKYFDSWQRRRINIANYYNEMLSNYVDIPQISPNVIPSWHKYVIQTTEQIPLKNYLSENGIETPYTLPNTIAIY